MKHQLLLLVLFSTILCSPLLRKLEEVTEESCKKLGKKYKETVKYKCKTGGSDFIVDKKDDCKSGTLSKAQQCSAPEVSIEKCSGTPTFTASSETADTCILDDVIIPSLTKQEDCEKKLVWTDEKCSISGITDSTQCTKTSGVWTPSDDAQGTCSIGEATTKSACEETTLQWEGDETTGSCSDGTGKTKNECEETHGVFSLTEKNKGSCSISGKTDKDSCEAAKGEWTEGSCSIKQFTTKKTCDGKTPKFTIKGQCKLGDTVISSRITEETCVVALKTEEVQVCSNKEVTDPDDCVAQATYTEVKVGECGDDISSNSNFLKAINFALFAICLLF